MKDHYATAHSGPPEVFTCGDCSKTFNRKRALMKHMIAQHAQAEFFCEVCDRGFTKKAGLTLHLKGKHGISTAREIEQPTGDE